MTFVNLAGTDWIKWNLSHEASKAYMKKVNWKTLFGQMNWDIWVGRCIRDSDGNN